jgi:hypothetical protein
MTELEKKIESIIRSKLVITNEPGVKLAVEDIIKLFPRIECKSCQGYGLHYSGSDCSKCKGTGYEN